ncbi:MAG TPA: hypothetical protein PLL86_23525, partial [Leptospiraceae bacterium]|nr:hypothetical protein [Leptospiraceae bacterium]
SCYTEDAILVVKPGKLVRGKEEIIIAHKKIAEYFKQTLKVTQGKMLFLEAGDTVLVLSQTFIESPGKIDSEYSTERRATYIYRKVGEHWLCAIDNSYGTELLNSD